MPQSNPLPRSVPKWRPTTYKGIEMRSRLEARVAAALDAKHIPWEYEPRAYADERAQYLPDFVIEVAGRKQYLDVKGAIEDSVVPGVQRRMEVIWASEPDAVLSIWEGLPVRRQWHATRLTGWWES